MNRSEAFLLLNQHLQNANLIKHSLAVEAGMKKLANYFGQNEEEWGLAGLLHDIDYELTKDDLQRHSLVGAEMVRDSGFSNEVAEAIKTHNQVHGYPPKSLMAKALFCIDPLTGLIVAAALVLPSRRLKDLTVESVKNRFREKSFARGADREVISKCQEYLQLSCHDFIALVLLAMQEIDQTLGL